MSDTFVGSVRKEDTIYRDEVDFDKSFKIDIDFAKMEFEETLNVSGPSSIFHVSYYGKPRVLKVLCDAGVVPNFYGFMLAIHPGDCAPHLDAFRHDKGLPRAILIEYLPKPLVMNCVTYTKERMQKAVNGIRQIHVALVEHNDPYPKNILIVPGDLERVIWIDFVVAIVYPNDAYIGKKERNRIEFETEVIESFGWMLEEDQKKGLPPNTKYYWDQLLSGVQTYTEGSHYGSHQSLSADLISQDTKAPAK
ncbi:hypothetical protein N7519_011422 [Penicillium mononematosum]|uniref:uncharacterized protein n=1 Tax=Penicillium mononematosum TaxID=268346 RepID=UPI0025497E88|nr:uncharacterized protein N7519_011422 [Penicillium mononematosum]KAJ6180961.1 hypothetical protein N7519_011422 [Penicillium mononematosum]